MCFPLYDILSKDSERLHKLTKEDLYTLANTISTLEQTEQEIIYVLIRIHHLKTTEIKSIFDIPYKGILKNGKDIKFNLEKMPEKLVNIIYEFTNKHLSTEKIVSPN